MSTETAKTAEGISAVAARAADVTRKLIAKNASLETENAALHAKVASYERADRVRTIAHDMEEKGLSPELTFEEKVASISGYQDLELVAQSVKLAGGGRFDLPRVSEEGAPGSAETSRDRTHAFFATGHPQT